jgi:fused signal recognition particle receptor
MEELKKINRVVSREIPSAPHEVLLVVDATSGQNVINQAKIFNEAVNVTGIALTKLDGTAKGGIILAINKELGIPVKLIGVGEGVDDLQDFNAEEFVEALFG